MQKADNIIYKPTGNGNTNFSIRNSTIVFDTDRPNSYRSSIVKFAAKIHSPDSSSSNNEISVRWSAAPHVGDNIVMCFDIGFGIQTGQTRIRYEHQHPEYTDALAVGDVIGYPLSDSYVELEFVKLDSMEEKATYFEVNETRNGDKMRLFSYKDTEHFVADYPNGCQVAIKPKENFNMIDIKDIIVAEIVENKYY